MIRHATNQLALETAAEKLKPGWLANAAAVTAEYRKQKKYTENELSWSDVKPIFTGLQFDKCAYCERRLADPALGAKEHEIEHYRPKGAVKLWPPKSKLKQPDSIYRKPPYDTLKTGSESATGYYLLAYNLRNYATACTACNSSLKSYNFPIAGKRRASTDDYARLRLEQPYVLFPIGDVDADDPEDLITFEGLLPVPKHKSGNKHLRARVTIDFFELATRDDLNRWRAEIITKLWLAHSTLALNPPQPLKEQAEEIIALATAAESPHTNCARAFHQLCQLDAARAAQYNADALALLKRKPNS